MQKKLLSILLALCMVLTLLPAQAMAAEPREFGEEQRDTAPEPDALETDAMESDALEEEPLAVYSTTHENQLYSSDNTLYYVFNQDSSDSEPFISYSTADALSISTFTSGISSIALENEFASKIKSAAATVRAEMKKRKTTISFYFGYSMDSGAFNEVVNMIVNTAVKHTEVPTEGDYLSYQISHWSAEGTVYSSRTLITLTIEYATTLEEELFVNTKIREILQELDLVSKSSYEKIEAIYSWICTNISYSIEGKHTTAYNALANGTCACQGYAVLLYRLLEEAGIDSRIISGYNSAGVGHCWNIVNLYGKYYYLDATWEVYREQLNLLYFLKGSSNWADHNDEYLSPNSSYLSEEFLSAYPISETDFSHAIGEASLYGEKENEQTRISELKYSAGNFSYTKSAEIDIENWETTDYDKVYMSLTLKLPEEWTELPISRVNVEISLPDGLSFSSDAMETVRTFSFVLSTANELYWIPDPIYLLYSEHYTEGQELGISYTLTTGDSSHSLNRSTHLVYLDVLSTVQTIKILRENGSIDIYDSWNSTMFMENPALYNGDLALLSAYLSDLMEGDDKANLKTRIQSVLAQFGFSKIQYSGAKPFDGYIEEYVCATKKVLIDGEVKTILIFAIQGSDTVKDWLGNLTYTGLREYYENFRTAYKNNLTAFLGYCDKVNFKQDDPSVRILITGHSRGGAIANLVAAELAEIYPASESSVASNLYCYTFAAPNVEALSSDTSEILDGMDEYYNIFNIINCEDIAPFVPGGSMEKHGHKLIFNSHYSTAMGTYYGNPAEGVIIPLRLLSLSSAIDATDTLAINAMNNIKLYLNGFEGVLLNHSMQTYIDAVKSGSYDASYSAFMKHVREQESHVRGLAVTINACSFVDSVDSIGSNLRKIQNIKNPINARLAMAEVIRVGAQAIWKEGLNFLVHCPVDIEIQNSEDITICTIIDDQIQFYDDNINDLSVLIYGDEKEIWYPKDSGYKIRIIGYGNGTMDYTLISTDGNGDAESMYNFYDVPVFKDEIVLTSRLCEDTDGYSFTSGSGVELQPDESLTGSQIETVSIEIKSDQENVFALGSNSYAKGDYVLAAALCLDDSLIFCGWYDENNQLVSMDEWYCFVAETDTYLCARYGQEAVAVTGITLDESEVTLTVGDTATLTAAIAPENATNKTVTWTSSDPDVATVEDGVVTAKAAGSALITVTTVDGGFEATCEITVNSNIVAVTGITLDKREVTLTANETETLMATITPDNATNQNVTWTSSDATVATVSDDGVVTAVKEGTATITVTTEDGNKTAECTVTVTAITVPVDKVELDKTTLSLAEGSSETLRATINPDNATNQNVTWTSSDTTVATVSDDGVVTAVKEGTATITVTTEDGNKTAECTVTIEKPTESPTPEPTETEEPTKESIGSVTGTITNLGKTDGEITLQLLDGSGNIVSGTNVSGNSAEYTLEDAAEGTYTLRVSKPNYVSRDYIVTVGAQPIELDVEIWLIGDVNGDGKMDARDKRILYNHMANPILTGYEFAVGDVNGDSKIDARDKRLLYNHIAGTSPLW